MQDHHFMNTKDQLTSHPASPEVPVGVAHMDQNMSFIITWEV